MISRQEAWTRIDLQLPDDIRNEIVYRPPYLVEGFFYSCWASRDSQGEPTTVVTKLTPDGRAVEAFGDNGTVRIPMPGEWGDYFCFVVDGEHLLCGVALRSSDNFAIFRLNKASGAMDIDFGHQGYKIHPYPVEPDDTSEAAQPRLDGAEGYAGSVPQFPDGKLRQMVNSGLAQFDMQGNLDTSFNEVGMRRHFRWQGRALQTLAVNARYRGTEHAGFHYCGDHRVGGDETQAWVGACDKNGAVLSGFAEQGVWIVKRLPGHPDLAYIAVHATTQAHDRLYLTGNAGTGTNQSGFVHCLKLDGTVDNRFNDGQAIIFKRPEFERTIAFALTPHGSGVLVGCRAVSPIEDQMPIAIVRLDENGHVDTAFGDQGWLITPEYPEPYTLLTLTYDDQEIIELRGKEFIARHPL
ncbi:MULTISPECIES: hypothetical protein [Pseudomonas]|uniref:hypothetical protein n=1 Tax=Pseudomonas TaxID=286 RepID=UPI00224AF02E|nr:MULTISPECIES: hypothetical protein [unclassified Pseudomonas]MCX2888721.1 hypothetical protein [Pseudomonas sp. DCB_BI]MDH4549206.1 hypothetical protein [Pseudomonas sp. BN607]